MESETHPARQYVGFTEDIASRIKTHNKGGNVSTAPFKPWKLLWHCVFPEKKRALDFERYLKSHSGKAFAQKRLLEY